MRLITLAIILPLFGCTTKIPPNPYGKLLGKNTDNIQALTCEESRSQIQLNLIHCEVLKEKLEIDAITNSCRIYRY